jgi:hypothetical protein
LFFPSLSLPSPGPAQPRDGEPLAAAAAASAWHCSLWQGATRGGGGGSLSYMVGGSSWSRVHPDPRFNGFIPKTILRISQEPGTYVIRGDKQFPLLLHESQSNKHETTLFYKTMVYSIYCCVIHKTIQPNQNIVIYCFQFHKSTNSRKKLLQLQGARKKTISWVNN